MSNDSKSNKSSKYDKAVVEKYKKFVGKKELKILISNFTPNKFAGKWKQAMCSPSTKVLGSGPNFSSVQATYKLKKNGLISVRNDAFDNELKRVYITGTSRTRDEDIPTCRTVKFNNLFNIEGDYWIAYATPSFKTVIVSAPIVIKIFNRPLVVTNNFGFYVLTRNIKDFWNSPEEHVSTLNALEKYGFNKPWNKAVVTGEAYEL
jgi:lipocalin